MKVKSKQLVSLIIAGVVFAFSTVASAHVTVYPKETKTGAYEKYTVRVPVEKDINTTKIRVEFPAGLKVSTVKPIAGWNYAFEKDSEGRNTAVTWTATAGGIKPHEFMEFEFVGANPKEPGTLIWKAYQTYANNDVVEWTGAPGSDTPASTTTMLAATGGEHADHEHGAGNVTTPATPATPAAPATPPPATGAPVASPAAPAPAASTSALPLSLSVVALVLSIISLSRRRG